MKHKLKLSFWALGILVLIMSQLFFLFPTPQATAAQTLTLDSVKERTYKYSVYAAFHYCTTKLGSYSDKNVGIAFEGVNGLYVNNVGFTGPDDGNNDGLVFCDQASRLWSSVAGYASYEDMLTDLGFKIIIRPGYTTLASLSITGQQVATNHEKAAKAKGIPTSEPQWGRYMLAYSALEAKCTGNSVSKTTVSVVSDDIGTISTKGYSTDTYRHPAFPDPNSQGYVSSCAQLMDMLKDTKTGTAAFAAALAADYKNSIIAAIRERCEILFPASTESGTVGEYENQVRNDKIAACVAGAQNKTTGYCDLTYLGLDEASGSSKDTQTEYEKKGKQYAQDLRDACQKGQGVDTEIGTSSDDESVGEFDICTVLDGQGNTPMRWLACSVLQAVSGVADFLFDMIESMLYTPVSEIFADQTYQDTISKFRLLSMALIFIAGLIMVIAQATGSDIVDAYTIRKVLPKLGVAIVGIAIAVPIMKFAVTLVNDIGLGMGNLVTTLTPRAMAGEVVQGNAAIGGVLGVLSLIAVGLGGALVMGPAIVTYAVVAMVALLVAFLTLAMRQLVIVTLVLLAPLAIATSVLPGTDKFWKFWRTTFITTLMMFPIIVLFLKSGIFMADIFGKMGNSSQNGLYGLIAAIIFIVPYFMLPIAFKMAGGLVGNIFGMVNDRSKGLFDRMRNWRANGRKQKTADLMAGNRFKGNTRVGNFINRRGENINAVRTGQVGLNPAKWGSQLQSASSRQALTEAEEALQKNPHMLRLKANDDFLQAGLHFNDAQAQRQYLLNAGYSERQANEAVASIRAAKRSMSNEAFENAAIIALPATGTYGKTEIDAQGNLTGGKATLVKDILKASRGDMNRADTLLALARQSAGSARRWDQAGGSYGDDRARMHALATPGSGMSEQTVTEQSLRDYIKSNGPGAVAQVRGNTVKPVAKIMMDDLQKSAILNGVGSEQFSRDLASLAGLYDTMGSMSPENATAFAEELMSSQIAGRTDNIQQMIEAHRDNDDFLSMRREYSSRYNQQAVAAAAVGQQQQQPQQPPGPGP